MDEQRDLLARLRVASPCRVGWGSMSGDERVRFCAECGLHVYNFAEMSADEVRAVVSRSEGRVCGRLYRRADGTVLTRDCPVGLRAVRRRVARAAGASLAAVLSLFSAAASAQTKQKGRAKQDEKACKVLPGLAVERKPSQTAAGSFAVEVLDVNGALIAGADVTLTNERTGEVFARTTTDEGAVKFLVPSEGEYTVGISAAGFEAVKARRVRLSPRETARARVTMQVGADATEMGIIVMDDAPFAGPGGGVTTFNSKQIESLPHG